MDGYRGWVLRNGILIPSTLYIHRFFIAPSPRLHRIFTVITFSPSSHHLLIMPLYLRLCLHCILIASFTCLATIDTYSEPLLYLHHVSVTSLLRLHHCLTLSSLRHRCINTESSSSCVHCVVTSSITSDSDYVTAKRRPDDMWSLTIEHPDYRPTGHARELSNVLLCKCRN